MYANEWAIYQVDGYYVGLILPSCQTQRVKVINQSPYPSVLTRFLKNQVGKIQFDELNF